MQLMFTAVTNAPRSRSHIV